MRELLPAPLNDRPHPMLHGFHAVHDGDGSNHEIVKLCQCCFFGHWNPFIPTMVQTTAIPIVTAFSKIHTADFHSRFTS